MVQVKDGRASVVLLDFGMTVCLSEEQRVGYAKLALSAQQMDLHGLQEAVGSLGIVNSQAEPARDLEFWRFFLRDTDGRTGAKRETNDFFEQRKAQRADDKKHSRPTRKLEAFPPNLIFFFRVIGLLRGLCATLEVKVPYMDILAARAKIALAGLTPLPERALMLSPPPKWYAGALPMHRRLSSLLAQLVDEGSVGAGVQVPLSRPPRATPPIHIGLPMQSHSNHIAIT